LDLAVVVVVQPRSLARLVLAKPQRLVEAEVQLLARPLQHLLLVNLQRVEARQH